MLGFLRKSIMDSQPQDLKLISSDNNFLDENKFIELIKALSAADFVGIDAIVPQDQHLFRTFSVAFEAYMDRISTAALPSDVQQAINAQVSTSDFIKRMIKNK